MGRDFLYALRVHRSRPGAIVVILLTLALGIGVNTAVFSFLNAILLKPLPYAHAERIVGIWERRPTGQANAMSALNYLDYSQENTVFEKIAATTICCSNTMPAGDPTPTPLPALKVSASYFDVFAVKAALGRTFMSGEDQPGRNRVAVVSHRLWASRFGSDTTLIGRAIRLNDEPYTGSRAMPRHAPRCASIRWTRCGANDPFQPLYRLSDS